MYNAAQAHILKGVVGGLLIGIIGALFPETLFWAESETQTILDAGATPLPHVWPDVGALGRYSLDGPAHLFAIGTLKLVAIGVSVLAGYRGGFIFPFMFAGNCLGCMLSHLSDLMLGPALHAHVGLDLAAGALGMAASINTAVTRTVLATPIVLITLSARPDVFPSVLISSVISLYMTGDTAIITAARKRLRREQLGADQLTDCWTDKADKSIALWKKSGSGVFSSVVKAKSPVKPADTEGATSGAWLAEHLAGLRSARDSTDNASGNGEVIDKLIRSVQEKLNQVKGMEVKHRWTAETPCTDTADTALL